MCLFQRDPAVRKEFLPIRAQLLTAKYGSPAYSDQGYKSILFFFLNNKSNSHNVFFSFIWHYEYSLMIVVSLSVFTFKNHFAGALGVDPLV